MALRYGSVDLFIVSTIQGFSNQHRTRNRQLETENDDDIVTFCLLTYSKHIVINELSRGGRGPDTMRTDAEPLIRSIVARRRCVLLYLHKIRQNKRVTVGPIVQLLI